MMQIIDVILIIVLVLNLFALGTSRIISVIHIVATQGVLLGVIPLLLHEHVTVSVTLATIAAILLKGMLIPFIMIRSMRSVQIKREVEPLIGLMPSVIIGALVTAFVLIFSRQLPLAGDQVNGLIVPASIATVIVGFVLLTTRFKAISQVLGYLVLENGIFLFGMMLVKAIPLVVEMGMFLDLLVGIFVISIITNHINQAFSSLDTRRLVSLKEE